MIRGLGQSVCGAIARAIGLDELLLATALSGVTVGLWPRFGQEALIVPSLVLLWIVLPERKPFVERQAPADQALVRRKS